MDPLKWLLDSDEPWTRYRSLVDLRGLLQDHPDVVSAREALIHHPQVKELVNYAGTWPGHALKRHNDASHPIYAFSTLADFGLRAEDSGMVAAIDAVFAHQSDQGAFQTLEHIPKAFGGPGEDLWTWILCDAPTLLYALLGFGLGTDPRVQKAVDHLVGLVEENGWRCVAAPELGRFKGPGRRGDPCPIANVYSLKALAQVEELVDSAATRTGAEMLLRHWDRHWDRKLFLFGAGTDFSKVKYPNVWYDILHVLEVLSRFPFVHADSRFLEMMGALTGQADEQGCYSATSMYRAWKGWSFADKKHPSPWLTFMVLRIQQRVKSSQAVL